MRVIIDKLRFPIRCNCPVDTRAHDRWKGQVGAFGVARFNGAGAIGHFDMSGVVVEIDPASVGQGEFNLLIRLKKETQIVSIAVIRVRKADSALRPPAQEQGAGKKGGGMDKTQASAKRQKGIGAPGDGRSKVHSSQLRADGAETREAPFAVTCR